MRVWTSALPRLDVNLRGAVLIVLREGSVGASGTIGECGSNCRCLERRGTTERYEG
jgi:hypothetical protein